TDVIVVNSSSKYLFDSICEAGGDFVLASYKAQLNKRPEVSVITVKADGRLALKRIYFLEWKTNTDTSILCKSIEKFASDALEKAVQEKCRTIAFPAIKCGFLTDAIIKAAGEKIQKVYDNELENHPNSVLIATPSGALLCKQIFFVKWDSDPDEEILRQSLVDLMYTVVQNVKSHNFTSIAFPAIGCGKHGCSINIVVKTMVLEMKRHLITRNLSWTMKFVVEPDQENIYDEFSKQVLTTQDGKTKVFSINEI
ncbi:unnamed protein product, partial [Rotaria sp. Silwood2]